MTGALKWSWISEQDYLAGELVSPIKHEYIGGTVHAMAGAGNRHNTIAVNITGELRTRLKGRPCQPFNSDTKIHIRLPTHTRYYYPDALVVCRSNPDTDSFQDDPVVVVEVLSHSTRRLDDGEKRDGYLTIPSLRVYLLVEQDEATVVAYRRTEQGFVRELYAGRDAVLPLPEIGIDLPLSEIYERVEFTPETEIDEPASHSG